MAAPKKANSSLSKTLTPPKSKATAKPTAKAKDKKASTFAVLGRAKAGGELGYKKAAAEIVRKESLAFDPIPAWAYSKNRKAPLEMQMKSDRQRTASRVKAQLKKDDKNFPTKQTSTKQIDYANNNKPAFKVKKTK
jgi:1-aminocyclopropane-1-carboxylate deaminase/D-cysteine desulfhydrase-like pyridoxal-dependent ACC family enzyme